MRVEDDRGEPVSGITRETRTDYITRVLSDDILHGRLAANTRLDEQTLAKRFGLSRTPVREALNQLAAQGFVLRRPHRGVVVAEVPVERMMHMFEVLGELKAICARLASQRMSFASRANLRLLHRQASDQVRRRDAEAYEGTNDALHLAICEGASNPFLLEVALDVGRRLSPFRRTHFDRPDRLERSHAEHEAIVGAIVAQDADAAYVRMRDHMMTVTDPEEAIAAGSLAFEVM